TRKAFVLQKKISDAYLEGKDVNAKDYHKLLEMTKLSIQKKHSMYHNRIAKIYLLKHHNKKRALEHIKLSLKNTPFNIRALKLLIYSFFVGTASKNQNIQ